MIARSSERGKNWRGLGAQMETQGSRRNRTRTVPLLPLRWAVQTDINGSGKVLMLDPARLGIGQKFVSKQRTGFRMNL